MHQVRQRPLLSPLSMVKSQEAGDCPVSITEVSLQQAPHMGSLDAYPFSGSFLYYKARKKEKKHFPDSIATCMPNLTLAALMSQHHGGSDLSFLGAGWEGPAIGPWLCRSLADSGVTGTLLLEQLRSGIKHASWPGCSGLHLIPLRNPRMLQLPLGDAVVHWLAGLAQALDAYLWDE